MITITLSGDNPEALRKAVNDALILINGDAPKPAKSDDADEKPARRSSRKSEDDADEKPARRSSRKSEDDADEKPARRSRDAEDDEGDKVRRAAGDAATTTKATRRQRDAEEDDAGGDEDATKVKPDELRKILEELRDHPEGDGKDEVREILKDYKAKVMADLEDDDYPEVFDRAKKRLRALDKKAR